MTIEGAIQNLQQKALQLPGMKAAPEAPPDSVAVFPFAITYERTGNLQLRSAGFADDLVTIFTDIHVNRQSLPQAVKLAMTFRDPFIKAILSDPKLGDTVSTVNAVRRTFGVLSWSGMETLGYRFEIDVKVQVTA